MTTETPRRRGRPPGSKSKPRPSWLPPPESAPLTMPRDVTIESVGPIPIRLVIASRSSFGKGGTEEEVEWPAAWPIPRQHDTVICSQVKGQVQYVTYNLERGVIIVAVV